MNKRRLRQVPPKLAINGQSLKTEDFEKVLTRPNGIPYYYDGENFFKVVCGSDETGATFAVVREAYTDTVKDLVEEKEYEQLHNTEVADRLTERKFSSNQKG